GTVSQSARPAATTAATLPKRSSSARRRGGDAGDRGEERLGRLVTQFRSWPLRVCGPLGSGLELLAADGKSVDPQRRVAVVAAAQERNPLVDRGEADAPDGVVVERSAIAEGKPLQR